MKTYSTRFALFIMLSTMLLFIGCQKEKNQKPAIDCVHFNSKPFFNTININNLPTIVQDTPVCGLFPLGKNHRWIYRDSLFDNSGLFIETKLDTLFIEKSILSLADNATWWKMKSRRNKSLPNYLYTTDSVLYWLNNSGGFNVVPQNIQAVAWLRILTKDSVRTSNAIDDVAYLETIKKLNSSTIVPAGSFDRCIETTKYGPSFLKQVITVKPNVGIVKIVTYSGDGVYHYNEYGGTQKRQVSELLYYSLE